MSKRVAVWLVTAATVSGPALAQAPKTEDPAPAAEEVAQPQAGKEFLPKDWPACCRPFGLSSATMTDDWFKVGPGLRDIGIDFKFFYQVHLMSVWGGGQTSQDSGKWSATYDLLGSFDLGKMGILKDADVLVHARHQWGRSVNRLTGATEEVNDDADGDHGIYVDQLWFRQHFLDRKIALQVGYLDYQTIVDRNVYANSEDKQFMNSALDNNPIIPTASQTGLGAALYVNPCDWYSLIVGAGDAQRFPLYNPTFSSTFHDQAWFTAYVENNFQPKIPTANGPLPGNYRVGMVYDPLPREVYEVFWKRVDQKGNDVGLYLSFDQMLYRENDKDTQGLGAFFRYAYHHDDVYRFNQFWSIGAVYNGLVPTRNQDVLGFAFAQKVDSDAYREHRNADSGNESIYELYYAIQVTPWLVVTPDVQYIDNPGANDGISHAWAGGLRFRVTF